jgi:hydroxyacylglutathione hydrolase
MSDYELYTIKLIRTCSNCYILVDSASREAAVIDPGSNAEQIIQELERVNAKARYIIDSHGHWDHIGANLALAEKTGAGILIHRLDQPMLADANSSLASLFRADGKGGEAERLLEDGDIIELGKLRLTVLHTPGHTPGGICLLVEDLLFSGDTLFNLSVGRTDLYGGDTETLINSLRDKLLPLPDQLQVLPGHGAASELGYEKAHNPYFPR